MAIAPKHLPRDLQEALDRLASFVELADLTKSTLAANCIRRAALSADSGQACRDLTTAVFHMSESQARDLGVIMARHKPWREELFSALCTSIMIRTDSASAKPFQAALDAFLNNARVKASSFALEVAVACKQDNVGMALALSSLLDHADDYAKAVKEVASGIRDSDTEHVPEMLEAYLAQHEMQGCVRHGAHGSPRRHRERSL